ncbi:AMP-binding protein [Acrocarpospora catenulata]|uniref:AMP-binding protein n=1 Tax=Acrocarpospora catenulata TaxID=2836182 RepID=UPI001BD9ACF8|nr:AMP-binding protein [Acrocarpospora catenulata]
MRTYSPYDSLNELMELRAERRADALAVNVLGVPRTYGELWLRAGRCQAWLAQAGVRRGEHVAIMLPNSIEFVETFLGVSRHGAVAVSVNTATVGEALHYTLDHSEACGIVIHASLLPALDAIGPLPHLRWIVVAGGAGGIAYDELVDPALGEPAPVAVRGGETCGIIYTSGTTGPPKGVMLPHTSYVNTGGYFAKHLGLGLDDVLHTCLPLFHCNAQQTTFMAGLHLGVPVHVDGRFSLSRFWSWIERSGATVTNVMGTMLTLLSKLPGDAASGVTTLRYILAAPVPEELHRPLERRLGVRIVEGYGLTETGTMAIINPPQDVRSGTTGVPLEHVEARVVDEHDVEVPDGTPGQFLVRSRVTDAFMSGYFKEPEKTAEAMAGGWFHTGDVGLRRPDGYYVFLDRMKDTIRRRGENVSSFFIDKAVSDHPDVMEAAAIGVPSELSEEDVKVVAIRRPGSALTEAELSTWLETRLSDFMRPRYIEFVEDFPRTETGRIHKYVLRRDGVGAAWDRDAAPAVKEGPRG